MGARVQRTRSPRYFAAVVGLLGIVVAVAHPTPAGAQLTGDPSVDPIPALDLDTSEKSIVVRLRFVEGAPTVVESVTVVSGPNHAREGIPPYLTVRLSDLTDNTLEVFGAWHPQWWFVIEPSVGERFVKRDEGTGIVAFPFRTDAATMLVTDSEQQTPVASVDLIPDLHGYCRRNRGDADCTAVVNRLPSCFAGGPYAVECSGAMTDLRLTGACADPDGDPLTYTWTGPFTGGTASGPTAMVQFSSVGTFSVSLTVSDDFGGTSVCSSPVAVVDTTPPTIQRVGADPSVLWPPNHGMVPVTVDVQAADTCDARPACRILSVTSNEPVNGPGDGGQGPDWQITGDLTLNLRAERSGPGAARFYTIDVACADASGNTRHAQTRVTVPHDQKR